MSFSENMQYLRKKENLTQEQLAGSQGFLKEADEKMD